MVSLLILSNGGWCQQSCGFNRNIYIVGLKMIFLIQGKFSKFENGETFMHFCAS